MRPARASKEVFEKLKAREEQQATALAEFKTLVDGFDGSFWEQFKKRLLDKAEAIKKTREDLFFKMNEMELKLSKKEEETLRFVAYVPLDIVSSYRALVKENSELKEEIRSYGKRVRELG